MVIVYSMAQPHRTKEKRKTFHFVMNIGKFSSHTTHEHMVIPQAVKADVTSAIIPVNVTKLIQEMLQELPINNNVANVRNN